MEFRNLLTFIRAAELHSFSQAAREMGYSQSAVSTQIAQLEADLGAPLFERIGRSVTLLRIAKKVLSLGSQCDTSTDALEERSA